VTKCANKSDTNQILLLPYPYPLSTFGYKYWCGYCRMENWYLYPSTSNIRYGSNINGL